MEVKTKPQSKIIKYIPSPQGPRFKALRLYPLEHRQVALVDPPDHERLCHYRWFFDPRQKYPYPFRWETTPYNAYRVMLHEDVLGIRRSRDRVIDHINRNPFDATRENLRVCTRSENGWNAAPRRDKLTSKYKSVCYRYRRDKNGQRRTYSNPWVVRINKNGKCIRLSPVADEFEAWKIAFQLKVRHHGKFTYDQPWTGYSNPKHPNKPMNYNPQTDPA